MFLAKVLVGETHFGPADSTLKIPPPKKADSNSKFGFEVERYDSCSGDTNGSRVYIVYENGRAYPFYLISFQ